LNLLGWVLENQLYSRHTATIKIDTKLKLFETAALPINMDKMYMAFQPLKPLSDSCYEKDVSWSKMMILIMFDKNYINQVEFLISNTWGELFFDSIEFVQKTDRQEQCRQVANLMSKYSGCDSRIFVYQFADTRDPDIVYQIKKAYSNLSCQDGELISNKKKPFLDRL